MMKYDAIIIGGGHNGLVCAAYLSKKKFKVLVLEKNEELGGLVNYGSTINGMSTKVLSDLNINLERLNYESLVVALNKDQNHTIIHENDSKINFISSNIKDEDQKKSKVPRRMSRITFPKAKYGVYIAIIIIVVVLFLFYKDSIL